MTVTGVGIRRLVVLTCLVALGDLGALVTLTSAEVTGFTSASRTSANAAETTAPTESSTKRAPENAAPALSAPTLPSLPRSDTEKRPKVTVPVLDARKGNLPLDVRVSPNCVRRGGRATAIVQTVPGAHISLMVVYSDADNYGQMTVGPVMPDGTTTYTWVVPPNAAAGLAQVLVAGGEPEGRGGTASAVFHVQGGKEC